jgi:hypothetical protein
MNVDPNEHTELSGQVRRIQASKRFANAPKARNLLNYIVEKALKGLEDDLKETPIAQALYGKGSAFDPGNDRIVSQAAGDLRKKLIEYYADEGRSDPWVIAIPTGSFVPAFTAQSAPAASAARPAPSPEARRVGAKRRWVLKTSVAAAAAAVILLGVLYAQHTASKVRITSPENGATVGPVGDICLHVWYITCFARAHAVAGRFANLSLIFIPDRIWKSPYRIGMGNGRAPWDVDGILAHRWPGP